MPLPNFLLGILVFFFLLFFQKLLLHFLQTAAFFPLPVLLEPGLQLRRVVLQLFLRDVPLGKALVRKFPRQGVQHRRQRDQMCIRDRLLY